MWKPAKARVGFVRSIRAGLEVTVTVRTLVSAVLLYAGRSLGKAKVVFADAVRKRSRIHLTIRQRTRVLDKWPK
jgi:antitoxin (DNA-binding transcriptional repressor) of toxin-antitoxin stability system